MGVMDSGQLVYDGPPWEFVHRAEGKTWSLRTTNEGAARLNGRYTIVNGSKKERGFAFVWSPATSPRGAQAAEPNLEDAYMLHFQDRIAGREIR
jgi:hypothetical protein